ncbi:vWA domain-containing protein [Luedemannella helvata]|uniref:VWA-like domain-containing protein n=1 Tax=Luedemannella helvata TaxID=349315 RepID=A0ABP4VTC1_9ACTN
MDRTKLLAARYRAAGDRPYLASALYALAVVPSAAVPTMAVDRHWRCYANAGFVERTPVAELAGVWLHEVAHLLRDHHGRAERLPARYQGDHARVNLAQDCEINDDLTDDGVPLPADHIRPATFGLPKGLLFEHYLPDIPPQPACPRCGSGAYGGVEPWDLPPADRAASTVSPTEADAIRRVTADAIRAHQKSRGDVPAGWRRWADDILEPTVDWRQVLAGSVRQAVAWAGGAVDYTYRRPSRRAASQAAVVLPSLRRPVPAVAIVVDTSGSMSDDDLAEAIAEVAGVLRGVGIRGNRVTVLACDAAVHTAQRISRAEELEFSGGGGTDMREGIAAALAQPQRPDVVVVLTDGETPWPNEPVATRVIAGLIGDEPPLPPEWIESVRIGA